MTRLYCTQWEFASAPHISDLVDTAAAVEILQTMLSAFAFYLRECFAKNVFTVNEIPQCTDRK